MSRLLLVLLFMTLATLSPLLTVYPADLQVTQYSQSLCFTANHGQWPDSIQFRAASGGAILWFSNQRAFYQFTRDAAGPVESESNILSRQSLLISAQFVGANSDICAQGQSRLSHNTNFFIGNDAAKWRRNVPNYAEVSYLEVYDGIDLRYFGNGYQLEYDFILSPGADINQIAVRYDGIKSMAVNFAGDLLVKTEWGEFKEQRPLVYQEIGGQRVVRKCAYRMLNENTFGFKLIGDYSPEYALVIDPVLVYSTLLGDNLTDQAFDVAIDDFGSAYLTGTTNSPNFPFVNAIDDQVALYDVFITKFTPDGDSLFYSTVVGGSGQEFSGGIAVDAQGNAIITGYTVSNNYPLKNAFDTSRDGDEAFITKISPNGDSLIYSTLLGGDANDQATAIAVDGAGNTYVTGNTYSINFPTQSAFQPTPSTPEDAFVTKVTANGSSISYSTYLGGDNKDYGHDIAVDDSGYAYITGMTRSNDFPELNPLDQNESGDNAFLTKLSKSGNSLVFSTYLSSSQNDAGYGICVEGLAKVHVVGVTRGSTFPQVNPLQPQDGGDEAFVTTIASNGSAILFSTFFGGGGDDQANAVGTDTSGSIIVVGTTNSSDLTLKDEFQANQPQEDIFVTRISPGGDSLIYSTYLGGAHSDFGEGVVVDPAGQAYVAGHSEEGAYPLFNAFQSSESGTDAVLTKLSVDSDGDGLEDPADNCKFVSNPGQANIDGDSFGDACDNCPSNANSTQVSLFEDFDSVLEPGWQWIRENRTNWSLSARPGYLRVQLESGEFHNSVTNRNLLLRPAPSGNFVLDTYIDCGLVNAGDQAMLVVYGDEGNFVKFGLKNDGGTVKRNFAHKHGGTVQEDVVATQTGSNLYLRLARNGAQLKMFTSSDGFDWIDLWAISNMNFTPTSVVLSAFSPTGGSGSVADFAYFRLYSGDADYDGLGDVCDACADCPVDNVAAWLFGNTEANMWSPSYWSQFSYCAPPTPCNLHCTSCAAEIFPNWSLFTQAIGPTAAFINGNPGRIRPSAKVQWNAIRGSWNGSCFGFAITNTLFRDGTLNAAASFPPHTSVATVPLSDSSRLVVNKYFLHQYGFKQQQWINQRLTTMTPLQTLAQTRELLNFPTTASRVLMLFNQNGSGGHAVVPYRVERDGGQPRLCYIYVHDNIYPNDFSKRIVVDTLVNTWEYSDQGGWGGTRGLFLMDGSVDYTGNLQLAEHPIDDYVRFYINPNDSVRITDGVNSIGNLGDSLFNSFPDASSITPPDGSETRPIGYFLPNGEYVCEATNVVDGYFGVINGTDRIFEGGTAKSGIISNFAVAYSSTTGKLKIFGQTNKAVTKFDVRIVDVDGDTETTFEALSMPIKANDSVAYSVVADSAFRIENYGSATTYDLLIESVSAAQDTVYFSSNISLAANTGHVVMPSWLGGSDSAMIFVDSGNNGSIEDTLSVPGQTYRDYTCGDADGNSIRTISDAVYLINYIFAGGSAPSPLLAGDADCNSIVTISDAVYLINYIFGGGPQPCASCP